ncbi:MAG: TonB-dependent receptor plug domain-containing protein, partial [Deltaproteobacteria bacterium]|nr:TonB-dependent receptor plug domain-containing protein [Deltaproteobacteria bacterium]
MRQTHQKHHKLISRFFHFNLMLLFSAVFILGTGAIAVCQEAEGEQAESSASESYDDYILEDTVVTATKRSVRLQDVPQAITAFSQEEMEFMGARNFSDLVESVPGVEFRSKNQSGAGSVSIRGIVEMSSVQGGPGASVG